MFTAPQLRAGLAVVLLAGMGCGSVESATAPVSDPVTPTIQAAQDLQAIDVKFKAVGKDSVALSWVVTDSETPVDFRVYRDDVVLQDVMTSSFLDAHIVEGQSYKYRIGGLNKDNVEIVHSATIVFEEVPKR